MIWDKANIEKSGPERSGALILIPSTSIKILLTLVSPEPRISIEVNLLLPLNDFETILACCANSSVILRIKVTYWFKMYSEYDGELMPQEKEGITKVKWIPESKLKKVLNNSYANIKLLV